jgi:hypothetical protein
MTLSLNDLQARKGQLLVSPEDFLRHHVLYTPGTVAPAASGLRMIYLSESNAHAEKTRPGSKLGVLSRPFHKTDAISISNQDPNAVLGGAALVRGHPNYHENMTFNVHWIATSFHPTVPPTPFPWYTLTDASGLMLTQRLTGCSFLINVAGGATQVAHIMPTPPESGQRLRARLVA